MVCHQNTKHPIVVWLALWLLVGSGGCAIVDTWKEPCVVGPGCCARHAPRLQYVIPRDPCFGYRTTCWYLWPGSCLSCPPLWTGNPETAPQGVDAAGRHTPPVPVPPLRAGAAEVVPAPRGNPRVDTGTKGNAKKEIPAAPDEPELAPLPETKAPTAPATPFQEE